MKLDGFSYTGWSTLTFDGNGLARWIASLFSFIHTESQLLTEVFGLHCPRWFCLRVSSAYRFVLFLHVLRSDETVWCGWMTMAWLACVKKLALNADKRRYTQDPLLSFMQRDRPFRLSKSNQVCQSLSNHRSSWWILKCTTIRTICSYESLIHIVGVWFSPICSRRCYPKHFAKYCKMQFI